MVGFVDRALLQLHDAAALANLLKGAGPAPYPQLTRLIESVFDDEGTVIDHIADLSVLSTTPLVKLPNRDAITATLITTQPGYVMTDLRGDLLRGGTGQWAHLVANVQIHVVVAVDPGGIESAVTRAIENIQSLDDFASRFRYLDLPAFLASRKITTVEELRQASEYVLAEVRLKPAPPFDATDPANAYDVTLNIALVILDQLDLAAGLMAAQLLREAAASSATGSPSSVMGPAAHPFAVGVIFPATDLGPDQPTAAQIDALYASTSVLPLFASPP